MAGHYQKSPQDLAGLVCHMDDWTGNKGGESVLHTTMLVLLVSAATVCDETAEERILRNLADEKCGILQS